MLAKIVFVLILIVVFSFQPFTTSDIVPSFIRVPVLFFLVASFTLLTYKKKITFYILLGFTILFFIVFPVWYSNLSNALSDIVYVFTLILFFLSLMSFLRRMPSLVRLMTVFFLGFTLFVSISAIFSYVCYNYNLLPYSLETVADYKYYFNPLLGYINPKDFGTVIIGRVCHFMLEPSYLSWFLTTSFYLLDNFFKEDKIKQWICRIIIFLGAMSTLSTSAFVVFPLLFLLSAVTFILKQFRFSKMLRNAVIIFFLLIVVTVIASIPKTTIAESLGKSSLGDRENRIESSLLILATSGYKDIILGRSPAYIAKTAIKGESNQYIKTLIEEGLIVLVLSIIAVIYCTRNNFNFMLANLIFLNSVVVFWTPLFFINLLICKFNNKPPGNSLLSSPSPSP